MRKLSTYFKKKPRIMNNILSCSIGSEGDGTLEFYSWHNPLGAVVTMNTTQNRLDIIFPCDVHLDVAHMFMDKTRFAIDSAGYNYTAILGSSTSDKDRVTITFMLDSSVYTKLDIDSEVSAFSFRFFMYSDI